jgi:hypothetical protein
MECYMPGLLELLHPPLMASLSKQLRQEGNVETNHKQPPNTYPLLYNRPFLCRVFI